MRIVQTDRWGTYIRDLQPLGAVTRTRDLDGTDQLELTVKTDADKGDRIMAVDTMGRVCEWEVSSIDAARESGAPTLDLVCVAGYGELSLTWIGERQNTDYSASACLEKALDGTRWEVGTCESGTLNSTATTSWYHESVSDALEDICDTYGLELEASYELDSTGTTIAARYINLYEQRGSDNGKRFTYGKDLTGIRRTIGSTRPITRCYGYGKGVEVTDEETGETTGGYSRKIDFADVNDGLEYVDADDEYLALWGVPGPDGDILPAVGIYENGDCEDEEQLLAETIAYLAEACEPTVSYTCDVAALGVAGVDAEGVDVGDVVQIVDTTFPTPLRLSGRVTQLVEDLRDGAGATTVTLGSVVESYAARQASIEQALETVRSNSAAWSSAAAGTNTYISDLIARINELMNATGGYVYLVEGEGIYVYDQPVDEDPTACIHIGGGYWRCANSKTSSGEWDWQTMADGSGLYAGALYTGILSDAAGENYWDLDTGELSISAGATIGDYTVSSLTVAVEGITSTVESAVTNALSGTDYVTSSELSQTANSITSSVTETLGNYVTSSELSQTANSITATFESSAYGRNLYPGFSLPIEDDGWASINSAYWTVDGDGWATFTCDNTDGTSIIFVFFNQSPIDTLDTDATYTVLAEIRDCTVSGTVSLYAVSKYTSSIGQFSLGYGHTLTTGTETSYYDVSTTLSDFSDCTTCLRSYVAVYAGASCTFSCRVSLYEGEYSGQYNSYIDSYSHSTLIRASGNGVEVGLYEDGSYTGSRTQMNETGFYVLNSSGSVHAAMNTGGIYFLPNGTSAANIQAYRSALGYSATAAGCYATAIGRAANAYSNYAVAIGDAAIANGATPTAIGYNARATGANTFAGGYGALASGTNAIALGRSATANATSATAVGMCAIASGTNGTAIGRGCKASADYAVALGADANASANRSCAIGPGVYAIGSWSTAMGLGSHSSANYSVALGYSCTTTGANATALGVLCGASGTAAVALGYNATASSSTAVAIGYNVTASGCYSTAMGRQSVTSAIYSTALGYYATCANANGMQLGSSGSLSSLTCRVSLTVTSDSRDKADVEDVADGATDFLRALRAVTFVYNHRESYEYPDEDLTEDELELRRTYGLYGYDAEAWAAGERKGSRQRAGFLAQEVQAALEEVYGSADYANLVNDNLHDFDEVPDGVESRLAMNYEGLIPFIVKAIQELDARVTALEGGT